MTLHGCRAKYYTGTVPDGQSIPNVTFTAIRYNYTGAGIGGRRCYDTDGYHPFLADANLTGTVTKTAGNVTIVGSGTAFLTELAVGDPVRIPGGETYYPDVVVVASIADNTHFNAYAAPQFSGAGKTAVRDSTVFAVPASLAGYYQFTVMYNPRSGAGTIRETNLVFNGFDKGQDPVGSNNNIDENTYVAPVSGSETALVTPVGPVHMAEGAYVQLFVYQDSGGTLGNAADLVGYPFTMWRVGV